MKCTSVIKLNLKKWVSVAPYWETGGSLRSVGVGRLFVVRWKDGSFASWSKSTWWWWWFVAGQEERFAKFFAEAREVDASPAQQLCVWRGTIREEVSIVLDGVNLMSSKKSHSDNS